MLYSGQAIAGQHCKTCQGHLVIVEGEPQCKLRTTDYAMYLRLDLDHVIITVNFYDMAWLCRCCTSSQA